MAGWPQGAGRRAGAHDRGAGERERPADGRLGGAGEVGEDADAVHLADHLLAEPAQPGLSRPGRSGEGEGLQAERVQGAQDAEGVADRRGSGGAEQHGYAAAVAGVGGLPRGVHEPQALGVGVDDRPDQVQLLQGGADGPLTRQALRKVQRPEQRADVALAHPRHIGVHPALAQFQVVPGQLTQHPGQPAVAVGDGVRDQEGVRLGQLGRGLGGPGHGGVVGGGDG